MNIWLMTFSLMIFTSACDTATASVQADRQAAPAAVGHTHLAANPAGCVALVPWPGDRSGALVSVTMRTANVLGFKTELGPMIVKLLDRDCNPVAASSSSDQPQLARTIVPSVPYARIDPAVFRISPSETALGVDVGEELTTSSVLAGDGYLILYRHVGVKMTPIFQAKTDQKEFDKTDPRAGWHRTRHIVRFTSHLSHGFYDLVLARPYQRRGQTFVWTGTHYAGMGP
jgi:hypothetical protein